MPARAQALGWARTRPACAGGHVGVAMCTCDLCKGPFVPLVQAGADVNAQARALAGSAAVGSGSLGTCMVGTGASPAPALPALPAAAASPGVPGSRGCRQPAGAFARGRGRCARAAADGRAAAQVEAGMHRDYPVGLARIVWCYTQVAADSEALAVAPTLLDTAASCVAHLDAEARRPPPASRGPAGGQQGAVRSAASAARGCPLAGHRQSHALRGRAAQGRAPGGRAGAVPGPVCSNRGTQNCLAFPSPCPALPSRRMRRRWRPCAPSRAAHICPCSVTLALHCVP